MNTSYTVTVDSFVTDIRGIIPTLTKNHDQAYTALIMLDLHTKAMCETLTTITTLEPYDRVAIANRIVELQKLRMEIVTKIMATVKINQGE